MAVTGNIEGVHAKVISRLESISKKLGKDVYVHDGKRTVGTSDPDDSAHHYGIAVDVMISGKMSKPSPTSL